MNFILKNKFWLGMVFAVLVVAVLHMIMVVPKHKAVEKDMATLEEYLDTLDGLKGQGSRIATRDKIRKCGDAVEKLEEQYSTVVNFFKDSRGEKIEYFPGVKDSRNKLQPAVFKDTYYRETEDLEKELEKRDVTLAENVFPWVDFGENVPTSEECDPVMRDFRILEHVSGLLAESKAVTFLEGVNLGSGETIVLKVQEEVFYARLLEIRANVLYSRLLFLIAKLHGSPLTILVETVSIEQAPDAAILREGEETPVAAMLVCRMLRRGEGQEEEEEE